MSSNSWKSGAGSELSDKKNLVEEWKNPSQRHAEALKEAISEDKWMKRREIEEMYQDNLDNREEALCSEAVYSRLSDMRKEGEVEIRGPGWKREYRLTDKPVEPITSSDQVEAPDWFKEALEEMVQKYVQEALRQKVDVFEEEIVEKIQEEIEKELDDNHTRQELLDSEMSKEKKVVRDAVDRFDEWTGSSDIYETYKELCEERELPVRGKRSVRGHLKDLAEENLIQKTGEGRWTEYRN